MGLGRTERNLHSILHVICLLHSPDSIEKFKVKLVS